MTYVPNKIAANTSISKPTPSIGAGGSGGPGAIAFAVDAGGGGSAAKTLTTQNAIKNIIVLFIIFIKNETV
ncbi:hypothetical protein [Flavobacterium fluviatile]|uniref:hypothetical protein n=1 Tax=Flavobacterium fluviatile TaxID=1862387 RepID=UPI0013D4DEEF|nr:hypothetical protein [Flavobacterium fluviatile]